MVEFYLFIFLAVLGLCFCARASSSCGKRGPLFIAVRGPLTIVASLVAEHRLQTHRLSSCGSRAQLLCDMWDLPRPGFEPVSPALAGRFSTTAPPGKPFSWFFKNKFIYLFLAALGLRCCMKAFSSCVKRCGARASHCCGARALGARVSVVVARRLSSCGSQALEHRLSSCGTWA